MSRPLREGIGDTENRIQTLVPARRAGRRVAGAILVALGLVIAVLIFTPWQQTIVGNGQVGVYSVMERPQTVDAQLGGRLREWLVQEGQLVKRGQLLAVIEDTDAAYLAPERLDQLKRRLVAQRQRRSEQLQRAERVRRRIRNLEESQPQQLAIARRQKTQSENSLRGAGNQVTIARKALEATQKVAQAQARERLRQAAVAVEQARDRREQTLQSVAEDQNSLKFQELQTKRIIELEQKGLRSGREREMEENRLVAAQQKLARAKKSVELASGDIQRAEREVEVVRASGALADIDVQRAQNAVQVQEAALQSAQEAVGIAESNILRIEADSSAPVRAAEADLQAIEADIASIDDAIAQAEQQLGNMQGRIAQQKVFAPIDGRVSRIGKTIGPGQTVKRDDDLCELVPQTRDQAVELYVSEADASLVRVGRQVRIQFNGFPAVQVSGFPQAAYGTFAGTVSNIDPDSSGKGGVRLWVIPDASEIGAKREKPWPGADLLRPGTGAVGWVLLEKVPLWYELWRQFNAFPPEFRDEKPQKDGAVKLPKR